MQATTPLHYPANAQQLQSGYASQQLQSGYGSQQLQSGYNSQQQQSGYNSQQPQQQSGYNSQQVFQQAHGYPQHHMSVSAATPSYQAGAYYQTAGGGASISNAMSYGSGSTTRGTPAGPERVQSTRKISSTIVNEQMMGPPPADYPPREVEVPGPVEEKIIHVPRREVIETEVRVPKYEYEYVDRIVEVPRIEYVDRVVEVPQYQDVVVEKKVTKWVDVPREVIREVKVPKINYIDRTVEVPGEIIEVPKPYTVEQKVEFTRYTDKKRPVIVAQSVKPVIAEGSGVTEVDVYEYEPECVPVDVHVVKGVQANVQAGGVLETVHRVVTVPSAQYNTVLQQLNSHLSQAELQKLPYLTERGQVMFLGERFYTAEVQAGATVQGLDQSNLVTTYVDQASRKVIPINDHRGQMMTHIGSAQMGAQMLGTQLGAQLSGQQMMQTASSASYMASSSAAQEYGSSTHMLGSRTGQATNIAVPSGLLNAANASLPPSASYSYSNVTNATPNPIQPQLTNANHTSQSKF